MEEFSLGDNDLLQPLVVTGPFTWVNGPNRNNHYSRYYDSDTAVRVMRAHIDGVLNQSMRIPSAFVGIDPADGNDYTATVTWEDIEGIRTATSTTYTNSTDWSIHADSAFADYEEEKPIIKNIDSKEAVFEFIVDALKRMMFEARGNHLIRLKNILNNNKKEMEKHFDKCIFICDARNNKQVDETSQLEEIVVDFYFTEKVEQVRRTYRFVLNLKRNTEDNIDVFERFLSNRNVSNKNKERVGESCE